MEQSLSREMPDMRQCGLPCLPGAEAKYEGGGPPVSRLFAGSSFSGVWVVSLRRMGGLCPSMCRLSEGVQMGLFWDQAL